MELQEQQKILYDKYSNTNINMEEKTKTILMLSLGALAVLYLWSGATLSPNLTERQKPAETDPARHDEATGFPDSTAPTYQPASLTNSGLTPAYTTTALGGGGGSTTPF